MDRACSMCAHDVSHRGDPIRGVRSVGASTCTATSSIDGRGARGGTMAGSSACFVALHAALRRAEAPRTAGGGGERDACASVLRCGTPAGDPGPLPAQHLPAPVTAALSTLPPSAASTTAAVTARWPPPGQIAPPGDTRAAAAAAQYATISSTILHLRGGMDDGGGVHWSTY